MNNAPKQQLIRGTDVIGLDVVTLQEGKRLHRVNDIIYDPQVNKVTGLLIEKGGWFSDAKIIAMEDVQSIGEDAVVILSEVLIRRASEISQRIANIAHEDTNLTKTRIITDKGTDLGTITDIYFDSNGIVEEFEVSEGMLKAMHSGTKRIRVTDIITIGSDATIVREETTQQFEQQGQQQGLQGAINTTKRKAGEWVDVASQKTQQMHKEASTMYEQKKNDPQTQDALHTLQEKNTEWMNAIEEKTDSLKENVKQWWDHTVRTDIPQVSKSNKEQQAKEQARETMQQAKQTAVAGKDALQDKVEEVMQKAKMKTRQIKADMEAQEQSPRDEYSSIEYPPREAESPYATAGMKGGKSKTQTKK